MIQKKQVDASFGQPRISSAIQKKIGQINWEVVSPKLLGVACGLVLGGLLAAGLWASGSFPQESSDMACWWQRPALWASWDDTEFRQFQGDECAREQSLQH